MKKAATLIAITVAVPLLLGATGRGCSSPVQQAPARAPGKCVAALGVTHALGEVVGGMAFRCTGAAVLTVNMYLLYNDPSGDGSFDQQARRGAVSSAVETSPITISAPCRPGKWKLRVVGEEMGVDATIRVDKSSEVVNVVC